MHRSSDTMLRSRAWLSSPAGADLEDVGCMSEAKCTAAKRRRVYGALRYRLCTLPNSNPRNEFIDRQPWNAPCRFARVVRFVSPAQSDRPFLPAQKERSDF